MGQNIGFTQAQFQKVERRLRFILNRRSRILTGDRESQLSIENWKNPNRRLRFSTVDWDSTVDWESQSTVEFYFLKLQPIRKHAKNYIKRFIKFFAYKEYHVKNYSDIVFLLWFFTLISYFSNILTKPAAQPADNLRLRFDLNLKISNLNRRLTFSIDGWESQSTLNCWSTVDWDFAKLKPKIMISIDGWDFLEPGHRVFIFQR